MSENKKKKVTGIGGIFFKCKDPDEYKGKTDSSCLKATGIGVGCHFAENNKNIYKYPYLRLFAIYIAMSEGILQAEGR